VQRYKSPDVDEILAEFVQAGGNTLCCEIHRLISSIWNKEELPQWWKKSVIVPVYKRADKN
jgi:hypothetical protein